MDFGFHDMFILGLISIDLWGKKRKTLEIYHRYFREKMVWNPGQLQLQTYKVIFGYLAVKFQWGKTDPIQVGTIHAIHSPDSRTICQRFHHYRRPSPQWSTGSWLEKQIPTVSFSMTWVNFPEGPQYP